MFGPDDCFDYRFNPCPVLGLGEGLLAALPVAVPKQCNGTTRDEPGEVPVATRDLKVKASPVFPTAAGGTELQLFRNNAGEDGVEFGVKAFLIVEEAPWAKYLDGHSTSGFRDSVSEPPQIVVSMGLFPCRGCGRCYAPKAVGAKPD